MSNEKGSDQTEQPTDKKLQDARKEGNVTRSQDLSKTLTLLLWLLLLGMTGNTLTEHMLAMVHDTWLDFNRLNGIHLVELLLSSMRVLLMMILPPVLLVAILAVCIEFLQVGPIFSTKRITPDLSKISPAEGFKKIFSQENIIELIKSIIKTAILIALMIVVVRHLLADLLHLPYGSAGAVYDAYGYGVRALVSAVVTAFIFISIIDIIYQKHAYIKKLMMSRHDIKQEHKESEGDPMLKSKRRQLHQEWSQQSQFNAVRNASAVVTNPTHIAVALFYEKGKIDLPRVVAKGQDHLAEMIKKVAQEAGVPIMQNIELARALYSEIAVESHITPDYFEAVAQILHWAENIRLEHTLN